MAGIGDFFFGKSPKVKQHSSKSGGQMQMLQQMIQQLSGGQGGGQGGIAGSPAFQGGNKFLEGLFSGDFSAFEGPLIQQFEQQTAPGIAERFAGMGAGSSSGLNQALAQAGSNLTSDLGAQRAGLMMNALPQALSFGQAPFKQQMDLMQLSPFSAENEFQEGTEGALGDMFKMAMAIVQMMGGGM